MIIARLSRGMSLLKLHFSMIGTLALLIGLSTLFITVILSFIGSLSIFTLLLFIIPFNLIQWLIAPRMIDRMYKVKAVSKNENPRLYGMVERLSQRIGMKMPRVMISDIPIPNAFAYGSPIAGKRVAVTTTLLKTLEEEEVEAVLGHELGHLKHRDVQIMMFASVLPAIFYWIYISFMFSALFGGYGRRNGGGTIIVAIIAMAIYWLLSIFVLGLSRLREYYADRRSVMIVDDGGRKMSEALAKIVNYSANMKMRHHQQMSSFEGFRTLFITDPERADTDLRAFSQRSTDQRLVREILSRKVTRQDRLLELFSTHPNIVKRLKALQRL